VQDVPDENTPPPAPAPLLTLEEVAACLWFARSTVYEMARGGTLPGAVKVRSRWLVRRLAFTRWLDAGCPPRGRNVP
jgi:excisionase family DNA binding protein